MRFEWLDSGHTVVTKHDSGNTLNWNCSDWNRDKSGIGTEMFEPLNRYYLEFPDIGAETSECMEEIFDVLDNVQDVSEARMYIQPFISRMFDAHEWEHFNKWMRENGGLYLEPYIKDELTDKDIPEFTYFTEDGIDLAVFSVLLKLIFPIWGVYYKAYEVTLGKSYCRIMALTLLTATCVNNNPAFIRLVNHVETFCELKINFEGSSILSDLSELDEPNLVLALTMWKKVCVFNAVEVTDKHIIKNAFSVLKSFATTGGNRPNRKFDESGSGVDKQSKTDKYKMSTPIPPGIYALIVHTGENPDLVLRNDSLVKAYWRLRQRIPNDLIIHRFHYIILGLVLKRNYEFEGLNAISSKMPIRCLEHISLEDLLNYICLAAIILNELSFITISKLLITSGIDKTNSIYALDSKGYAFLDETTKGKLNHAFRFSGGEAVWGNAITTILTEVSSKNWSFDDERANLFELPNELARLILL